MGMSNQIVVPVQRTVSWTTVVSATVGVFPGQCGWCKKPTPDPTDEDVRTFVQGRPGQNFMHAGDWTPSGWLKMWGEPDICPECVAALAQARASRRPPP